MTPSKQTGFTDDRIRILKNIELKKTAQIVLRHTEIEALLARLEALELIREFAGAPKHERWLRAEEAYLRSAGKEGKDD